MGFDWDNENRNYLKRHKVAPAEFEQIFVNNPLELEFQSHGSEERYKLVGVTNVGRVLTVIWTLRRGRIRAITAFPAPPPERLLYITWLEGTRE